MIETTGEGKSAVATPDGKKPKEEEKKVVMSYEAGQDMKRKNMETTKGGNRKECPG